MLEPLQMAIIEKDWLHRLFEWYSVGVKTIPNSTTNSINSTSTINTMNSTTSENLTLASITTLANLASNQTSSVIVLASLLSLSPTFFSDSINGKQPLVMQQVSQLISNLSEHANLVNQLFLNVGISTLSALNTVGNLETKKCVADSLSHFSSYEQIAFQLTSDGIVLI